MLDPIFIRVYNLNYFFTFQDFKIYYLCIIYFDEMSERTSYIKLENYDRGCESCHCHLSSVIKHDKPLDLLAMN
jgi:hypothetical protein